ncbi:twin-arginine translocase subunit TatC [Thermoflavimicrobium dichotomicum]|uniref:Sec-independent protein translocase protein TatC n=1 Tax=Thermoflavimicrobium dichotomicum TaxID=46223 RepID=A0A1I3TTD2_9BACL|nr:twin-arginine translocase subunit TatC [Thermoflavimicrobium dichotomicum]SFJ72851.1 sec-independent protein translocase protein TatC [Thermoflavimicrobium dichotomicum]
MHDDQAQPLSEHLRELRNRILWVLIFFLIAFIVSVAYAKDIFEWVRQDSMQHVPLYTFSPGHSLKVWMQIGFIGSVVLTLPVALYHIWQFVRPGLKKSEQRAALLYIPAAILLFAGGILFGYYVLFPYLIQFLQSLNRQLGLQEMYNVYEYFSFMVNIILPLGFFFELPVIVLFLTRIHIITPQFLVKIRRFAYLALVIIAAVITPPDVISAIIVTIPLIFLYEISILLSHWLTKKLDKEDQPQLEDEELEG